MSRKVKVLIIDDDDLIRETVKLALAHADFEAVALEAPALAHTVIRRSKPDLILLDLYMPELDGRELLRKLKADPEVSRIPVIIFTGSGESEDVQSGLHAGAVEYITKPIDGRRLVEKIQAFLGMGPGSDDGE